MNRLGPVVSLQYGRRCRWDLCVNVAVAAPLIKRNANAIHKEDEM